VALRIGTWSLDESTGSLERNGESVRLGPRGAAVLLHLARHPNEIASNAELLALISADGQASANALHKCMTELRQALSDDRDTPSYIETIPRRGYRMIAPVVPEATKVQPPEPARRILPTRGWAIAATLFACIVVVAGVLGMRSLSTATTGVAERTLTTPSADPEKSLAVLRFRSEDGNAPLQQAADVMSDKLIEWVGRWKHLRVAPRDSSYAHSLDHEAVGAIGHALDAAFVLDGSLQMLAGHVHTSVRLIRASDGAIVYAHEHDGGTQINAALADQVAAAVLPALRVHFSPDGAWREMLESGTKSVDAYLALVDAVNAKRRDDLPRSTELLREAIRLDPSYLRAYVGLTKALSMQAQLAPRADRRAWLTEVAEVRASVARLAPDSLALREISVQESQLAGVDLLAQETQLRGYIRGSNRADHTEWYSQYATLLYTARQFDAAEKYLEVYERVNGYSWSTSRAVLTMTRESPPIAAPLVEMALQTFPNDVRFVASAIPQLARNGAWDDADSQLENLERVDRDGMWAYAAKVELAVMRGDYAADAELLRAALADARSTDLLRGTVLFMRGDVDGGAAAWRAMPPNLRLQASGDAPWLETLYPASVPTDPRYQALLDELGVGAKWSAYMRERVHELAPVTGIEGSKLTEVGAAVRVP
jgi:DNA-binding winged helix-turn-helix (wHTH) protein/TolB-like protein